MPENTPDLSSFIGPAEPAGDAPAPAGIALRPGQTLCGDIDMRIGLDGTWYYASSPIGRKELVKLFSTVLHRDEAGDHWLITPAEVCRIRVDDAPYLAVEATVAGSGPDQIVTLRTNIDQTVAIGADHPLRVEVDPESLEPRPYVGLWRGLEARLTRSVYYQLVELAVEQMVEGANIYGIWSDGLFFSIGRLDQE